MRIGYLTSRYITTQTGGAEAFLHNLAKGVAVRGHKAVIAAASRGGAGDRAFVYGVERLNPLLVRLTFAAFGLGKLYLERLLGALQSKYKFDIWHVVIGYPLGAAAADFFNRNDIPCLLRCAGEDIQALPEIGYGYRLDLKAENIMKANYGKFDALIAPADDMKKDYISLGAQEKKIFAIPNGVDCARFESGHGVKDARSELGLDDTQRLIITVGRNHPKKAFGCIPEIIKRLVKAGARFKWLLIGRGCSGIGALAEKEGVGEYLILKDIRPDVSSGGEPEIPDKRLVRYYKAADVFVFPTLMEFFAKVVIEAMAAGLPVVTTDAPGVDSIIRHEENGLKAKAGNIEGLTRAILRLLSDEGLANRLGGNALRDSKQYDWEQITQKYMDLYNALLNNKDAFQPKAETFSKLNRKVSGS